MLNLQRLLRGRSEWNSSTGHIFWYMMDEHMHFWCHPEIMCSHGSHENFLKCAYIIFKFWIYDLTENANHSTIKHFEAFNQWMNQLRQKSNVRGKFWTLSTFKWFPVRLLSCDAKLIGNLFFLIRFSSKKTINYQVFKPSLGWSGGGGQRSRTVRLESRVWELEQLKNLCLWDFWLDVGFDSSNCS